VSVKRFISTASFYPSFNVLRLDRQISASVACVRFFMAFPAKHYKIFRRVKFTPFAIPNVMRVSESGFVALLAFASASFASSVHRLTKSRMGQIFSVV
jgi:hypothetical protein